MVKIVLFKMFTENGELTTGGSNFLVVVAVLATYIALVIILAPPVKPKNRNVEK